MYPGQGWTTCPSVICIAPLPPPLYHCTSIAPTSQVRGSVRAHSKTDGTITVGQAEVAVDLCDPVSPRAKLCIWILKVVEIEDLSSFALRL